MVPQLQHNWTYPILAIVYLYLEYKWIERLVNVSFAKGGQYSTDCVKITQV